MDEFDGPVYIREYGKLVCPRGYEVKSAIHKDDPTESEDCISAVPVVASACGNSVPSLLLICTHFVAQHLDWVDSLVDFPSIVGKSLFSKAEELLQFCPLSTITFQQFSLFLDAYGTDCLSHLSIVRSPKFAQQTLTDYPVLYSSLTHLELSSCQIGYHDDLLVQISHLENLEFLSLMDNRLTSGAIQKWTAPMRICSRGLIHLQLLNLACNPSLGDGIVKYLKCFSRLEQLDISGTGITEVGLSQLQKSLGLSGNIVTSSGSEYKGWHCSNQGWAAGIINTWQKHANTFIEDTTKSHSDGHLFYKKKTKVRPQLYITKPDTIIQLSRASRSLTKDRQKLTDSSGALSCTHQSGLVQSKISQASVIKNYSDEIGDVNMIVQKNSNLENDPFSCYISKSRKRKIIGSPPTQATVDEVDFASVYLVPTKSDGTIGNEPVSNDQKAVKPRKKIKLITSRSNVTKSLGDSSASKKPPPEGAKRTKQGHDSRLLAAMSSW